LKSTAKMYKNVPAPTLGGIPENVNSEQLEELESELEVK
jgi:hypothetical protein